MFQAVHSRLHPLHVLLGTPLHVVGMGVGQQCRGIDIQFIKTAGLVSFPDPFWNLGMRLQLDCSSVVKVTL